MLRVALILVLLIVVAQAQAELLISYRTPATNSTYLNYYTQLIALALEKTKAQDGDYRITGVPVSTNTRRSLGNVASNLYPNLLLELSYDHSLNPIKVIDHVNIPVDGGIYGYRVCFVNPTLKNEIAQAKSVEDLRRYTIGQGVGWADNDILRANGFKVQEVANFDNIFKMLVAGRIDLFCRGANQIKPELEEFKALHQLTFDESFVLYYPLPRFFYLNSHNQLAKKRIEEGLRIAFKDGSMKQLWDAEYRDNIAFVKLKQRKIFRLENPLLKDLSPSYEHYFFDPLK